MSRGAVGPDARRNRIEPSAARSREDRVMNRRDVSIAAAGVAAAVVAFFIVQPLAAPQQSTAAAAGAIPRTADGKPDLSGIWQVVNTAAWDIQSHHARKDVPAGQGVVEGNEIPYQPWALEKKRQNFESRLTADPESK